MHTKNKILLVAGVLLLGVSWVGWKAAQSTRRAEAALATLKAEHLDLLVEVERAELDLRNADLKRAETFHALEAVRSPKSEPAKPAEKKANVPGRPLRTITDLIAHDPKAEVAMIARQKAMVLRAHGSFFHAHRLSAEQIRRFEEIQARQWEQYMDIRALARLENAPGEQEIAALQQQASDVQEAAQAELLGEPLYRAFKEHERTEGVQNIVVFGFAGAAAVDGIPITAQQGEQLLQAAVEAAGPDPTLAHEQLIKKIDWAALDEKAQKILTPPQFTLFKNSAPYTGFSSRWKYELDTAVRRAYEAEGGSTP
jgi:hypothetical protein